MAAPLQGNIKDYPLPDVLEELRVTKATGTLIIKGDGGERAVHLKDGQIIFATSSDGQDRLGETLVRAGKLTKENLDTALTLMKKCAGFKKLGAILVENRFVSPKDLFTGLKTQVKEILYSLFLLEEAGYRFEENLPPDVIQLQFNIQELIMEIIQRIKEES